MGSERLGMRSVCEVQGQNHIATKKCHCIEHIYLFLVTVHTYRVHYLAGVIFDDLNLWAQNNIFLFSMLIMV